MRDRVGQPACTRVIAPLCEANVPHTSDGVRPKRRTHQAVTAVKHARIQGWWVVEADRQRACDTIEHTLRVSLVARRRSDRRVLKRIRQWLHAGVVAQGPWPPTAGGSPHGGVRSPWLAHLSWPVLEMYGVTREAGLGALGRYAEDIGIVCRTPHQAEPAFPAVRVLLQTLKRQLHPTTTRLGALAQEGFACLGCHVPTLRAQHTGTLLPYRWPSQQAMKARRRELHGRTSRPP